MLLLRSNTTPDWTDTPINDLLVSTAGLASDTLCNKVRYIEGTTASDTSVKVKCD